MLVYSVNTTSTACLSVREEGSLLCCASRGFFHLFFLFVLLGSFFLNQGSKDKEYHMLYRL